MVSEASLWFNPVLDTVRPHLNPPLPFSFLFPINFSS
jgi:hypothetical protein